MKIEKNEYIITAFAQGASGPGWANTPIYIVVQDIYGKIRTECLQPTEQTPEMWAIYKYSNLAHCDMVRAVERKFKVNNSNK